MKTDRQSRYRAASRDTAVVKQFARIWFDIATCIDVDVSELVANQKLILLPAHLIIASIGEVRLSDGSRFSATDWRANRLAGILPTIGAQASALVKHRACQLGQATCAANKNT